jgi:hypothetical protein
MLSERYGSEERDRFRKLLAREYDNCFAYKLATQLRNVSQHVDRVINRVGAESRETDEGKVQTRMALSLDGPRLRSASRK